MNLFSYDWHITTACSLTLSYKRSAQVPVTFKRLIHGAKKQMSNILFGTVFKNQHIGMLPAPSHLISSMKVNMSG